MSAPHLLTKIQALSPDLRRKVEHFVEFLRTKQREKPIGEREVGYAKGKVRMSFDFDDPLDDLAECRQNHRC